MMNATIPTFPVKRKVIPFLIFMLLSLNTIFEVNFLYPMLSISSQSLSAADQNILNILRSGAILLSLYAVIAPWVFERFFLPAFRASPRFPQISPETKLLLASYAMLCSPVICGQFLGRMGLPIGQADGFIAAGILGAVTWLAYTLRKAAAW